MKKFFSLTLACIPSGTNRSPSRNVLTRSAPCFVMIEEGGLPIIGKALRKSFRNSAFKDDPERFQKIEPYPDRESALNGRRKGFLRDHESVIGLRYGHAVGKRHIYVWPWAFQGLLQ